jgi:FixJ family two-component response regulator
MMTTQKKDDRAEAKGIVYVVGDDEQVRETLKATLETSSISVVAVGSAREYWQHPRAEGVACLILDLQLPDADGLELQQQNKCECGPPVIFVTDHRDIECTVRAMKAGAIEFLTKPVSHTALLAAILAAFVEDRRLQEQRVRITTLYERFSQLTPREREVFPLIISGLRNKQAAWTLGIREVTLQVHRGQIMRKMAARSFAELVRMGDQLTITSLNPRERTQNAAISNHWALA